MTAAAPGIVDAGPQIAIPEHKKSKLPLLAALLAIAVVGLVAGHLSGRVSHARVLYNKTITDAKRIHEQIGKLTELDGQVVVALKKSARRNEGRIKYDEALVADLRAVEQLPLASPEGLKRLENALFRTNYAMMDDLLIHRLFRYYNNFIRLTLAVRAFVNHAEGSKAEILVYAQNSSDAERNFGIVVAAAKGNFFLGRLVEIGRWVCPDKQAMAAGKCKGRDLTGFEVRVPGSDRWTERSGKPKKRGGALGIVVPITPDKAWQSVATARRGYLDFGAYVRRYRQISGISALMAQERKELRTSLKKQAGHDTLFTL